MNPTLSTVGSTAASGSSSASLTICLQWALEHLFGVKMPPEVALAFAGLLAPILHQFITTIMPKPKVEPAPQP